MDTLRVDVPPAGMEIGLKLLFMSTWKYGPCAWTALICPIEKLMTSTAIAAKPMR